MVLGHLQSIGLRIQQQRLTTALSPTDAIGSRIRWSLIIERRKYSVPASNSLWHIDSHHNLINLSFEIHGCIDGYSKLVVFLEFSTSNKSEIFTSFI